MTSILPSGAPPTPSRDSLYAERLRSLSLLVGNTPLLAIDFTFGGESRTVYAKLESMNMTGCVKDRMALHILQSAAAAGQLAPGALIVEATSGNTGISFAALGRALGHPVAIFMPEWMSAERINLIRSFGADVRLVSHEEGGFLGSIRLAESHAAQSPGAFLPRQFSNAANVQAHERTTGPELWWQLAPLGLAPDAFVAGVGTGGTIMGVGRYLRENDRSVALYPVEPANSPTLSTGHKVGQHRIQGISDEFIPSIVDLSWLDAPIAIDDGDAIVMAQHLARQLGIAVGISSGANFLATLAAQDRLGRDAVVATVFPDSNKKYLSTDLMRDEPVRPDFLSRHVQLQGFRVVARVCDLCSHGSQPVNARRASRPSSSEGPPDR
jgi:cysteine synthase A